MKIQNFVQNVLFVSLASIIFSGCMLKTESQQLPALTGTPLPLPSVTPSPSPLISPKPVLKPISSVAPAVHKDTTPPMAYILSPTNNSWVSRGQLLKVVANVTDNVGVDRVEFYYSSSGTLVGTVKTPPYEVTFKIPDSDHSINVPLYVIAYDKAGNQSKNPEANILVMMNQ